MTNERLEQFIRKINYFVKKFDSKKYSLELYYSVINSEKIKEEMLKNILCWKIRGKLTYEQLAGKHKKLIDRAIEKISEINDFKSGKIPLDKFNSVLKYISPTGPVIRLFLLHICKPREFALFDRHVFRAFYYFKTGQIYKNGVTSKIVRLFYSEYNNFFKNICEQFENKYKSKDIDSALMAFGKELKKSNKEKSISEFM